MNQRVKRNSPNRGSTRHNQEKTRMLNSRITESKLENRHGRTAAKCRDEISWRSVRKCRSNKAILQISTDSYWHAQILDRESIQSKFANQFVV